MTTTENDLMIRLQSQFGDLDLTNLLSEQGGGESRQPKNDGDESEESSLVEPTCEELRAWQESQFQKGQATLEDKKQKEVRSAIQRRRGQLRRQTIQQRRRFNNNDDDDWEQVAALPELQGQSSVFFPTSDAQGNQFLGIHPHLQQLAEGDPEILGTAWRRLFSSVEGDGLSFYNLWERLRGYPGPTVLLIGAVPAASKSMAGYSGSSPSMKTTIGFFTTSPWMESTAFPGTSACFLFSMNDDDDNKVHFFKPRPIKPNENEPHYLYSCHPSSTFNGTGSRHHRHHTTTTTDGSLHGLGVGGTASQPRLHLTESLEDCRAMDYCRLFGEGDLLLGKGRGSLNFFDVDCLEVWAVGGEEWIGDSLAQQDRQRAISEAAARKNRRVDKKELWKAFRDGGLLSQGGNGYLAHSHHTPDRCDL